MDAALKLEPITVEEYLEGEELSDIRHEFLDGNVFAMAGGTEPHSLISGNLFAALHSHLSSGPCRAFIFDFKLRLFLENRDFFYYPDVIVSCDPRDKDPRFSRFPKVLVEVLSESTERIDRGEKFQNDREIPTLEEYVLIEQDTVGVTVFRRSRDWQPEIIRRLDDELRLPSIDFSVPLKSIYARVDL